MGVIVILGAGPHGSELEVIVERCGGIPRFFDDDPDQGYPPIECYNPAFAPYVIGAAWPEVRRRMDQGPARAATLVDPDASIIGDAFVGPGVVLAAGARIGPGVALGAHTHVNLNATISRGCQIGEMVTICPGANISGGVIVEDDVFIGAGAVIAHELVIGRGALIGAGAVVVEDVKPHETVIGNPGRAQ